MTEQKSEEETSPESAYGGTLRKDDVVGLLAIKDRSG
jgi:hypothetical protein